MMFTLFLVSICIQVLVLAVEGPTGVLLTDESICKAVQAAFMLGDPVTKPKEYGGVLGGLFTRIWTEAATQHCMRVLIVQTLCT